MRRTLTFALLSLLGTGLAANDSAREFFKFAKYSYDVNEYDKALGFVNKALELNPEFVSGLLLRADINNGLEDFNGVVEDINSAFSLDSEADKSMSEYHLLRGKALFHLRSYDDAITDLSSCIRIDPKNSRAYFLKAIINSEQKKYFEAVEDFDNAIKLDTDKGDYYYERARVKKLHFKPLPGTNTYLGIMNDIKLSMRLNPDDYRAYKLKCDMLKMDKSIKKEALIHELDKYIEAFPEQAEFYSERGMANVLNYNYGSALSDFTKAIHLNSEDEANYRNRGLCFHNMSKYQLALNDYSKSIDIMVGKFKKAQDDKNLKKLLAETFNMRGMTNQLNGYTDLACDDYYNAAKLGSKSGMNNYRRNCHVYNN